MLGRHAPLTAALLVAGGAGVAIGALIAVGIGRRRASGTGAIAFGAGFAAVALVFAAAAGVAAQLTQGAGAARGIAVGLVGFGLLAAGSRRRRRSQRARLVVVVVADRMVHPAPSLRLGTMVGLAALPWLGPGMLGSGLTGCLPGGTSGPASSRLGPGPQRRLVGSGRRSRWAGGSTGLRWSDGRLGWLWWDGLWLRRPTASETCSTTARSWLQIFEQLGGSAGITDAFFATAMGILALIATAYAIRAGSPASGRGRRPAGRTDSGHRHPPASMGAEPSGLRESRARAHARRGRERSRGRPMGPWSATSPDETPKVIGAALIQIPAVWVVVGAALALFGVVASLHLAELGSPGGVPVAWPTRSDTPVPAMGSEPIPVQSHPSAARGRFRVVAPLVILTVDRIGVDRGRAWRVSGDGTSSLSQPLSTAAGRRRRSRSPPEGSGSRWR